MKNDVLRFSYHTVGPLNIEPWMHVGSIDATLHASDAARLALLHQYNLLLVRSSNTLAGLFIPDYLREILPQTFLAKDILAPILPITHDLGVWIDAIDAANVPFHAELVNQGSQQRKCPSGHITSGNPCTVHHQATQPFP